MLTQEQLAAIERRAEAATKGPWEWYNGCSYWRLGIAGDQSKHDAVIRPYTADDRHPELECGEHNRGFIAEARTDIPRLLAHIRELEARVHKEHLCAMNNELSSDALMEARAYLEQHVGDVCKCAFFDDCIHNVVALYIQQKEKIVELEARVK